jgi:hypothetical protein
MAFDDEENEDDGVPGAFVYGSGPQDDPANPAAFQAVRPPAPAPIPAGASDDDYLKPPTYNPVAIPPPPASRLAEEQGYEKQLTAPPPKPADYKPSIGRRIGSSLAGALVGFGTRNAEEGTQVGLGALDAPLNRAQSVYQQKQQAAEKGLNAVRDEAEAEGQEYERHLQGINAGVEQYNAQDRAYNQAALARQRMQSVAPGTEQPDDPKNPMGTWHATTVGGQPLKLNQPPDSYLTTPQGKDAAETARRAKLVQDNRLTGDDAKQVLVNGQLRESAPVAALQEYTDWKTAFRDENGRVPNASEIAGWRKGGTSNNVLDEVSAIVADATQQKEAFAQKYQRGPVTGRYVPADRNSGPTLSPEEFKARIDGYRTGANTKLAKYGYAMDEQGQVGSTAATSKPPAGAPQSAASDIKIPPVQGPVRPNATPANPPAGTLIHLANGIEMKVGDPITLGDGKTYTVTGYNPTTRKPTVTPGYTPATPPAAPAQPTAGAQ